VKEIKTSNNISLVIIELPPKAHRPTNNKVSHQIDYLIDFIQITVQDAYIIRELWGEKFKIINFLKYLTDDEAKKIDSSKESLLSLLQQNGLNTDKNLLILQRI
jgi:hypothetical protein